MGRTDGQTHRINGMHALIKFLEYIPYGLGVMARTRSGTYGRGWSGGATVLGKLPVPGRPANLDEVGQGPIALAVGAGGGCWDIFSLIYHFYFLSPSLWETA